MNPSPTSITIIRRLIFLVYWLLIFEGVLRKWVFPEAEKALLFVRDPVVLLIYAVAVRERVYLKLPFLLTVGTFGVVMLAWTSIQVIALGNNPLVNLFGWKLIFFYLPFLAICPAALTKADVKNFVKCNLYVALPIALLVGFQIASPSDALINKGTGDGQVFTVADGVVRAYGTFTFTAGHAQFAAAIFAMVLFEWLASSKKRVVPTALLIVFTISSVSMVALAGSRGIIFSVAIIAMFAILGSLVMKGSVTRLRNFSFLTLVLAAGVTVFATLFSDAMTRLEKRQASAVRAEGSTLTRALWPILRFWETLEDATYLGSGIGTGSVVGQKMSTIKIPYMEDEWGRIFVELGFFFGTLMWLLRVAWTLICFKYSLVAARNADLVPLMLFSIFGINLFWGQVTMNYTANGFCWILLGIWYASVYGARDAYSMQELTSETDDLPEASPTTLAS